MNNRRTQQAPLCWKIISKHYYCYSLGRPWGTWKERKERKERKTGKLKNCPRAVFLAKNIGKCASFSSLLKSKKIRAVRGFIYDQPARGGPCGAPAALAANFWICLISSASERVFPGIFDVFLNHFIVSKKRYLSPYHITFWSPSSLSHVKIW